MNNVKPFVKPGRCGAGSGCTCSRCSYAAGYEDARQESMGMHLGTIDFITGARPPRRTPTIRALGQLAEALERLAVDTFGSEDWASFKAAVRERVNRKPLDLN